jgi:glyoxylase-like metal-dependent hydrolase (beta-lactamase superfamily II)
MAEILPGIHLIDGIDPSTHVFLVKDKGPTYTLIDTGLPGSDTHTAAYLKHLKIPPSQVKCILITHLHKDHTGALKKTIELTHAKTFAHWIEAEFIAQRPSYDGPGMAPSEPVEVDEVLKDGDALDCAGGLTVYHTPGHTPGHTAYYQMDRKLLFSGDLFFGSGEGLMLTTPNYTIHTQSAQISARRVGKLPVESVMSYHGGPVLKGGQKAIEAVVRGF